MARFGFTTGGSYTSESPNVADQRAVNWYPENVEGDGTTPTAYYPTPGLSPFSVLSGNRVRGMYEYNGRLFVVTDKFNEVFADGTFTAYSFLPDDGLPVTMEANSNNQLLICAAGQIWFFPLVTPATATITFTQGGNGPPGGHGRPYIQITFSSMPFAVGQIIYLAGLTTETWLNGTSAVIYSIAGNVITSVGGSWITNPGPGVPTFPYGPTADTGTGATSATIQVTTGILGAVSEIAFVDGYFIALLANSAKFQISELEDALTWNPINVFQISQFADNVTSMIVNQRQIFFLGQKRTVAYYDAGDPLIPFQPVPGAFIEQGITAQWSVVRMDNSIFWIGQDERGNGVAWRMNGYTPVRVSNHAVENIWRTYFNPGFTNINDVIAFTYQQNGHTFWVIWFPSAQATWVYDAATGQWHERVWLHNGAQNSWRARCGVFAFNRVLVGDISSGTVYLLDINNLQDALFEGTFPILRIRRAPHISNEQEWMYHQQLQVYLESGLGNSTVLDPQISLRWSNDGGHTWSNYYAVSAGPQGNFTTRCMWRRLGRARDRIYEISVTDAIPWRLVDSFLQAVPGFAPSQRLVDQFKQRA